MHNIEKDIEQVDEENRKFEAAQFADAANAAPAQTATTSQNVSK